MKLVAIRAKNNFPLLEAMRKHQQEFSNLSAYLLSEIRRYFRSIAHETDSDAIRKTDGCREVLVSLSSVYRGLDVQTNLRSFSRHELALHLTFQINCEQKRFALSGDL